MSTLRRTLALALLLSGCNPSAGSRAAPPRPANQRETAETNGGDGSASRDPLPTPADEIECEHASDCYPNAPTHATWCGPVERDFTGAVFETKERPGTMDGGPVKPGDQPPGCLCHLGRCGARLNDGRVVMGQQPAYEYRAPPPQPAMGETD